MTLQLSLPGTTLCYYKGEEEYDAGEPPKEKFNLTGELVDAVAAGRVTHRQFVSYSYSVHTVSLQCSPLLPSRL